MMVEFTKTQVFEGRSWVPEWLFEWAQRTERALPRWMWKGWSKLTMMVLYKEIPIEGEMKQVVMKLRMDLRKRLEGDQNG